MREAPLSSAFERALRPAAKDLLHSSPDLVEREGRRSSLTELPEAADPKETPFSYPSGTYGNLLSGYD